MKALLLSLTVVLCISCVSCSNTDRRFRIRSSYTYLGSDYLEHDLTNHTTIVIDSRDKAYKIGDTVTTETPTYGYRHYEVIVDTVK